MTDSALEPGSLLANRYRVLRDRPEGEARFRVIDTRDELSAGAKWVRLVVVRGIAPSELESALRRSLRYAVGVRGLAELLGVIELAPGESAVAYALPDGRSLDESLSQSEGRPWDARRVQRLSSELSRVIAPLHEQGIAHGQLEPELVVETTEGGVSLLGFGLASALAPGRAHSPGLDQAALGALVERLSFGGSAAPLPVEPAPAEPEPASDLILPAAPAPLPSSPKTGPTERLNPPPRPLVLPAPQSKSPPASNRAWFAILAIALGGVVMVGGVVFAFVLSRRHAPPPAPSAAVSAPTAPARPVAPTIPDHDLPPTPPPSGDAGAPMAAPSATSPAPDLSPPVQVKPPPTHQAAAVPVDADAPAWGPWDAPVTLTLFADLECPHTRALLPELVRLKATLGNDLRWVFRHRPLSQHPDAERSARLLAATGAELGAGAFWKLVTELARDTESEPKDVFETWFERAGLDGALRARLESSSSAEAIVDRDTELGARLLVRSTPTLFVNGIRVEGFLPEEALLEALSKERRAAIFALLSGTDASALYPERTLRNLVNLGEEPKERACIPSAGAPVRGPANAPVSIVTFCAFESSFCQKAEPALVALLSRHPRELRVVWKSFPVALDGEGRVAANFALAAREAGGDAAFWAVHGALLDARAVLDAPGLGQVVQKLGLDATRLLSAAQSGAHNATIDADVALGKRLGVNGVPTYFINGVRKDGLMTLPELEQAVKEELQLGKRLSAIGRGAIEEQVCGALGRSR
jgi:protein-disulfide isomerase